MANREDSIWYQMQKIQQSRSKIKEEKKESWKKDSRKKLRTTIEKKMKTSFIGALSEFEKQFGYLWEEDDAMFDLWNRVRKAVLDNSNNQLRAILHELECYDVSWNRYHIDINIKETEE